MKLNALGSAPPGGLAPVGDGDPWASTLNYHRHMSFGEQDGPSPCLKAAPLFLAQHWKKRGNYKSKIKAIAAAISTKGALRGRRVLEAEGNVPAVTPERLHLLQGQKLRLRPCRND